MAEVFDYEGPNNGDIIPVPSSIPSNIDDLLSVDPENFESWLLSLPDNQDIMLAGRTRLQHFERQSSTLRNKLGAFAVTAGAAMSIAHETSNAKQPVPTLIFGAISLLAVRRSLGIISNDWMPNKRRTQDERKLHKSIFGTINKP